MRHADLWMGLHNRFGPWFPGKKGSCQARMEVRGGGPLSNSHTQGGGESYG